MGECNNSPLAWRRTRKEGKGTDKRFFFLLFFNQEALREDEMPPLADILPHDENDIDGDDDDDDDVVAYGGDRQKFKCPLSLQIMTEPLKSTVCQHAFEKESILHYLGNSSKPCPTGCGKNLSKKTVVEDVNFTRACSKFRRRDQMRKESQRNQAQATLLD